jgi:hypothetical protein
MATADGADGSRRQIVDFAFKIHLAVNRPYGPMDRNTGLNRSPDEQNP